MKDKEVVLLVRVSACLLCGEEMEFAVCRYEWTLPDVRALSRTMTLSRWLGHECFGGNRIGVLQTKGSYTRPPKNAKELKEVDDRERKNARHYYTMTA